MKFFKIYKRILNEELLPKIKRQDEILYNIFIIIYTLFLWVLIPLTLIAILLSTMEEYIKCKKKRED